jgi:hypothetical protein
MHISLSPDQEPYSILNPSFIPINPQPNNTRNSLIGQVAHVPKLLSTMHIRYMNLDKGNRYADKSIANRNARVRQRTRIDQDGIEVASCGVNTIDYRAFVVGLKGL